MEIKQALHCPFFILLVCLFVYSSSDPDDWGCGCERRRGPGVKVQVDHGVVGGAQAAKGSACARLSVPQTLQVTLRRTRRQVSERCGHLGARHDLLSFRFGISIYSTRHVGRH